jgi:hypothetical protein
MKSLFILALLIPWFFAAPSARAGESGQSTPYAEVVTGFEELVGHPAIAAAHWKGRGPYGYYGRGDYGHKSHPYYYGHRHGRSHFYGRGHYYSPYRPHPFHGKGYYHRPHRGPHFGFSACYRSGSVRICINDAYPHHYRRW